MIVFDGWRVPQGFNSDGCTLAPNGSWKDACILHDFMRRYGVVSASMADNILRKHMITLGASRWVARVYWIAVVIARPWFKKTINLPPNWKEYGHRL